jgi:tetratricopeptide (TPR) repeat protein
MVSRTARSLGRRLLVCTIWLAALPAPAAAQARVVPYAGLTPGVSSKAEVDLRLGDPLRKLVPDDEVYEYAPPRSSDDTARVVVDYWVDTMQVARIDVYPRVPPAAGPIRDQLGTRVVTRDRKDGAREELFFPDLLAVILDRNGGDARVAAVSYLSPRVAGWVYAERSQQARAEKRLGEARTEADKAVVVDPDGAEGYIQQGQYFEAAGDPAEALVRYTAAARAKHGANDRAFAHAQLGRLYESRPAETDKARAEFDRAVAAALPSYRDRIRVWYAESLTRQKKDDDALAEYKRALVDNPANAHAQRGAAALLYAKERFGEALPYYEALSRAPETPAAADRGTIYARYAYCLGTLDRRAESIDWYLKALDNGYEKRPTAFNNLGIHYLNGRDAARALEYFDRGLALEPKDKLLNRNRTQALLDLGRHQDALKQAETALGVDPANGFRMVDMARVYGALKKKRDALQWITKAVDAGVKDVKALTTDPHLALIQRDSNFRRLVESIR